jgi:HlyD family secretion protein
MSTQPKSVFQKMSSGVSKFFAKIENQRWLAKVPKKLIRFTFVILILAAFGTAIYFPIKSQLSTTTAAATETLQTATVRTGNLVLYASGSGTLTAADQVDLAFSTGGQVKAVYFAVGDEVKKGDLIAEVDDTDAQIKYKQTKRALMELTSASAIASAQQAVATAQTALDTAMGTLEYQISPAVLHWELEVEKAKQAVTDAQAALNATPADTALQQKLKDTQAYLAYAEDKLAGDWYYYKNNYVKNMFTVWDRATGTKYIAAPTESEIQLARATVAGAQATLQEAEYLYAALTSLNFPEDATGSGLTALETARLNLESAQVTVDGTKIYAPISGTIMSISTSVGDTAGTSAIITVSDLSQYYLETFLDETDWGNVAVGYPTEITFDALPEKIFTGEVIQVDPGLYTSGNTSVVRAIVKLDTSTNKINLPIGTTAAVDVIGGRAENAMLVPIEALHLAGDQYTVFVMENGQPRLHVVEVGIQDLLYAEIKSGLKPGDIVTTGITVTK